MNGSWREIEKNLVKEVDSWKNGKGREGKDRIKPNRIESAEAEIEWPCAWEAYVTNDTIYKNGKLAMTVVDKWLYSEMEWIERRQEK